MEPGHLAAEYTNVPLISLNPKLGRRKDEVDI